MSVLSRRSALALGATGLIAPQARAWTHGGNGYTGSIASRCMVTAAILGSFTQYMARTRHLCYTSVASLQIVIPTFYLNLIPTVETGWGAASTVTAAIEYPSGTFSQVKFSGSTSGTVPNNSFLVSDPVTITIPAGAYFFVRVFGTNSVGVATVGLNSGGNNYDTVNGEAMAYGTGALVDQTMGGTITSNSSGITTPIAIIGQTFSPSCMLIGDSRCVGIYDAYSTSGNQQTLMGEVARWVGQSFAQTNFGVSGGRLTNWLTGNANQLILSKYFSHVICQYAVNDFGGFGYTSAQMIAKVQAARALFPGKPFFQTTCVIGSTSTDNWATLGNQTTDSFNANIQAFNLALRTAAVSGLTGFFDTDSAVENSIPNGLWIVNGTPNFATVDGAHETPAANLLIAASLASVAASEIHF